MTPETIDQKVESNPSFLGKVWKKGKYVVAALGAAYVIHGGYHFVEYNVKRSEAQDLAWGTLFKLNALSSYVDGLKEAGMAPAEVNRIFFEKMKEVDDLQKKSDELLQQSEYHLTKAWNPFY